MSQWLRIKKDPIKHELKKQKMREHYRAKLRPAHLIGLPVRRGRAPLPPEERERRKDERAARDAAARRLRVAEKREKLKRWHHCQIIHCKKCHLPFLRSELPASTRRCRPCNRLQKLERKARDPDRDRMLRRSAKHRRRARIKGNGGSCSPAQWLAVLARYGNKCQRCGSAESLTRDHIIPISKGGSDDHTNLQPLCRDCNTRKLNVLTGAIQAFIPGVKLTHLS